MTRTLLAIRCVLHVGGATLVMSGCGSGSVPLDSDSKLNAELDSGSSPNDNAGSSSSPTTGTAGSASPMIANAGSPAVGQPPPDRDAGRPFDAGRPIPDAGLAAFPLEELVCGEDYTSYDDAGEPLPGGYVGRCCVHSRCYPSEGQPCDSPSNVHAHFNLGSGDCACGTAIGPFAAPPAEPDAEGACCYAIPIVSCTGRPLSTASGHLLAAVITSDEWIA